MKKENKPIADGWVEESGMICELKKPMKWKQVSYLQKEFKIDYVYGCKLKDFIQSLLDKQKQEHDNQIRKDLLEGIRISWDIADEGKEWCVQIWKGNTLLESLTKNSDDGGSVRLLELLQVASKYGIKI
jgi:hypothetical protein